jgi:hypothetical protein
MSDEIQRLREARPEAPGPRDEVVASARAALMAEVTRGRPSRRWGRRRVLGLAAPALAAGVTAVVLALTLTGGSDEPARAAAVVRAAEAAPRLLVDEPGWNVIHMGGFSESSGRMTLAKGKRRLNLEWLPKEQFQEAVLTGVAEMEDLGTVPAAGDDQARLFRRPGTNEYIALWIRGEYMIEAQGKAMNAERFSAILASLHQVDTERWLDLIPERIELVGDSYANAIERSRGAVTALSKMSVFSRPQSEEDVLPRRLYYRMKPEERCPALGDTEAFCSGSNVPEESRLLLSDLGVRKTTLYAWPTTEGWVCYAWDAGAGGCTPDFAHGKVPAAKIGIDPDELGVGAPGVLVGIVPDDVVAVSVKVDGVEYPAVTGGNGFFFELPTAKCSFRSFNSVWLTFRDGTKEGQRLTMGGPVYPGDPPPPKCP